MGEGQPKDFTALLEEGARTPDATLLESVMLRSQSAGGVSPENIGHFGLALEAYAHFTSPIRRYPDLLVHRAIKHALAGGKPETYPIRRTRWRAVAAVLRALAPSRRRGRARSRRALPRGVDGRHVGGNSTAPSAA
jgi:exoribonuclease R